MSKQKNENGFKGTNGANGVIRPGELYTRSDVKRLMEVKEESIRNMIRKGLRRILVGRKSYFLADDIINFVKGQANEKNLCAGGEA